MKKKIEYRLFISVCVFYCLSFFNTNGQDNDFIEFSSGENNFPIVANNIGSDIILDGNDFDGVKKIAALFQTDIFNVTGVIPEIKQEISGKSKNIIIIGTLGKSKLLDKMVQKGIIDVSDIQGKWETSLIQVVENPFNKVERALIIVGSDKRGTLYGMFDISQKIGVSPWYWWADVPIKKHNAVYVKTGRYNLGEPKVKYRGIFLNDEEPALGRWAVDNYGGFTHGFYEKVFELLLRLKANYIWPAMWWAGFAMDDTLNPVIANEMGIVMGTSHHEPMMRAHAEWKKHGKGDWNYATNEEELQKFWKDGIQRMGTHESIITLAMRGDGDLAMSEEANTELLEKIVADQREIIEDVTGKNADEIPQLWALYKEVQEYYDKGMRVPDDVTLLLCDDNWGNVRHLPDPEEPKRKGGYGMYYHFDFVGGPRSYKWLNVSHISRVWEQMNLCYQHGVYQIWIVNVGDLKPMELPISFFLDFAWDPDKLQPSNLMEYHTNWAKEQFGDKYAREIGELLWLYTKYNRRRTPELLDSRTYSITDYREFEKVTKEYEKIFKRSLLIFEEIDDMYKDAYFQLVHFPVWACSNLYKMYFAQARNNLFYQQRRTSANDMADIVKQCFEEDEKITRYYHELSDGKWDKMASQTHIGYRSWSDPRNNILPDTKKISPENEASMGVTYSGTEKYWLPGKEEVELPTFDSYNNQSNIIEVFNRGKQGFEYFFKTQAKWINLSNVNGYVEKQDSIKISIDWNKLEIGNNEGEIIVGSNSNNEVIKFKVKAIKYDINKEKAVGFIERNGYVSMEANNYSTASNKGGVSWTVIPGLSKTKDGVTTVPVNISFLPQDKNLPFLEYQFHLLKEPINDSVTIEVKIAPTHNFSGKGLYYAIAIDNEKPQIINIHENSTRPDWEYPWWYNTAVSNFAISSTTKHQLTEKGNHVLKLYMISSGVVFQKLILDNGSLKRSYLGPPESIYME